MSCVVRGFAALRQVQLSCKPASLVREIGIVLHVTYKRSGHQLHICYVDIAGARDITGVMSGEQTVIGKLRSLSNWI